MASRKDVVFGLKIDDGDAVKDVKALDKALNNLDKSVKDTQNTMKSGKGLDKFEQDLKDLDKLIDEGSLDMRQMTKLVQDYQTIAFKAGTNSPVGSKAIAQAANLRDRLKDINARTNQLSSDYARMDAALQGAGAAMAGFQAFQGVTALIGDENEELLETITKLQAATGILNSIQIIRNALNKDAALVQQVQLFQQKAATGQTYAQITAQKIANAVTKEGTVASKALGKALLFTGIGALIAAIGILAANWDRVKIALGGATKAQQTQNAVTSKAIEAASEELNALDKLKTTINDNATSQKDRTEAVKQLQETYPELLSNIDAEKISLEQLNHVIELNSELVLLNAQAQAIAELRSEEFKKQIEAQVNAQTGANQSLQSLSIGLFNAEAAQLKHNGEQLISIQQTEEQINVLDKLDGATQTQITNIEKLLKLNGKNLDTDKERTRFDKIREDRAKSRSEANKAQAEDANKILLEQFALEEEIRQMRLTAEELEEVKIAEKYDKLIERANGNAQLEAQIIEQHQAELNALYQQREDEETARAEARIAKTAELAKAEQDLRISLMQEGLEKELAQEAENFEAKRIALQENETIAAEEKTLLLSDLEIQEQEALKAIRDHYNEVEIDEEKKKRDEKVKLFNDYANEIGAGLESIASISNAVTDLQLANAEGNEKKQDQIQRQAFERNKKIQISLATINTIQGVVNALTADSVIPDPFGAILKGINAAAVGAAGVANIAKIKAQKYQGGGGSASASIPRGGSAGVGASANQFSIANTSSDTTQLNPDGTVAQGGETPPIKVFVSENDISQTQDNVNQIDVKSTF